MSSIPITINTNNLAFFTTTNRLVPCEGPRAVPLTLDFTAGDTYTIDLQNMADLKRLSMVQAVYVDNSNGANSITITNQQTGQPVTVAAGMQGYRNVLCPNPAAMTLQSESQAVIKVWLLNYPVIDSTWSVT